MTTPPSLPVPDAAASTAVPGAVPWAVGSNASHPGSRSEHGGGTQPVRTLWARQPAGSGDRVTARARRLVEGLPGWEPLPPGETVVRRPGA
jgi:hypothetical protein